MRVVVLVFVVVVVSSSSRPTYFYLTDAIPYRS